MKVENTWRCKFSSASAVMRGVFPFGSFQGPGWTLETLLHRVVAMTNVLLRADLFHGFPFCDSASPLEVESRLHCHLTYRYGLHAEEANSCSTSVRISLCSFENEGPAVLFRQTHRHKQLSAVL